MNTDNILLMLVCATTLNAIIITFLAARHKALYLILWAIAQWMVPFASVGFFGRGEWFPLWLSVTLGNTFLFFSIYLTILGLASFNRRKLWWFFDAGALLFSIVLLFLFSQLVESYKARVVIAALVMVYLAVLGQREANAMPNAPFAKIIFLNSFFLIGFISVLRLVMILPFNGVEGLFDGTLIAAANIIVIFFAIWMFTYAMVISPGEEKQTLLERISTTDALTKQLNRRAFINYYKNFELDDDQYIGLIIFDVDHFKDVNNRYGHSVGDRVLIELCDFINDHKRTKDTFARLGGEEFALLFQVSSPIHARVFAESLVDGVARHFKTKCPYFPDITLSAGLSVVKAKTPLRTLLFVADQYLAQAKLYGRNQVYTADTRVASHSKIVALGLRNESMR